MPTDSSISLETLKYPIGKYQPPDEISRGQRANWIEAISTLPAELEKAIGGLNESQLDTPYRPEGWTVRQLVHHLADSHMNSQLRFRWALTEDVPAIKAYDEKLWAELPDAKTLPVDVSFELLTGLHKRWTGLLTYMTEPDFKLRLRHPASGEMTLEWMLGLYAWHGRHHVAQIAALKTREGW